MLQGIQLQVNAPYPSRLTITKLLMIKRFLGRLSPCDWLFSKKYRSSLAYTGFTCY